MRPHGLSTKVSPGHDARQVAALLALPEIIQFISDLDDLRWTGRPGNGARVLVGAMLVKAVYALPTMTRTARLIAEHAALREAIGGAPSQWACYRFAAKLREHDDALASCIDRVLARLHAAKPDMGKTVAIDGSDLPAYAQRAAVRLARRARCARSSATRTRHGATGRPSPPARAAATTATRFTPLSAPATGPAGGVEGRDGQGRRAAACADPARHGDRARLHGRRRACWTAATTPRSSTTRSRPVTSGP